jgi:hypothetical protein
MEAKKTPPDAHTSAARATTADEAAAALGRASSTRHEPGRMVEQEHPAPGQQRRLSPGAAVEEI